MQGALDLARPFYSPLSLIVSCWPAVSPIFSLMKLARTAQPPKGNKAEKGKIRPGLAGVRQLMPADPQSLGVYSHWTWLGPGVEGTLSTCGTVYHNLRQVQKQHSAAECPGAPVPRWTPLPVTTSPGLTRAFIP